MIQLEAGLAPSNSPAARLYLLSSIGFLTVSKTAVVRRSLLISVYFSELFARYRKVTTCARVAAPSGSKVVAEVPEVMPFS